ncbi:hypothetical protein A5893_13770 [Pedobacter psychrophilus]|uniref:Probable inorganic carbon transporter subunit DabA n=1 Tax=Pedobacter psychrophilus TaxID=1826909 RepID=A0A179DBY1_9SPHI|nr:DUF2309 domain-containing protein [Pedobacter psychrophilus]OAQ38488.1 hypothetical protein A5893_13770 [Pedobacter psychrophilus]
MSEQNFIKLIEKASNVVGKTFPLYAFVTSNPLSGYEQETFFNATESAQKYFSGSFFPTAEVYKQAWDANEIDGKVLKNMLFADGFTESPATYLQQLVNQKTSVEENPNHHLDTLMVKWLSSFLDEGIAEWEMPNREDGFYNAWRKLAKYDGKLNIKSKKEIPESAIESLQQALKDYSDDEQLQILEYHIAALAGWTGYIKYRAENNTDWQQKYPISLADYLAVRLWVAIKINAEIISPTKDRTLQKEKAKLQYVWLKAWEKTLQNKLVQKLEKKQTTVEDVIKADETPDAQLVFCIDTRSELIRRHIEAHGNYETFGFAGFFGIATDYKDLNTGIVRKSCPPIVSSAYTISEKYQDGKAKEMANFKKTTEELKFKNYFLKRLKNMLPSAFGYVEGSGLVYGASLVARSLFPGKLYQIEQKNSNSHENFCDATLEHCHSTENSLANIPLTEKVAIVYSAFAVMGWQKFAPLVVFAGHGSHSKNNPFGSSLDCGACAASPGRNNARMLTALANLPEIKKALASDHNLLIPENTFFIGAEHNTTTESILLFDSNVPASHQEHLKALKENLSKIQLRAIKERRGLIDNEINHVHKKANNWAETRPEWGLAKNAGFIIGHRSLSKNVNLESRCFLQSYNWKTDDNGSLLEAIMQGPMTVTQWINNHYYFSTVDNDRFGGGSKITHNVTGGFGVLQGNGGDLKIGIPLQSVNATDDEMFHQPLRLSVIIEAPLERVTAILHRNPNLKSLITNEWIYLMVMDPLKDAIPKLYVDAAQIEFA